MLYSSHHFLAQASFSFVAKIGACFKQTRWHRNNCFDRGHYSKPTWKSISKRITWQIHTLFLFNTHYRRRFTLHNKVKTQLRKKAIFNEFYSMSLSFHCSLFIHLFEKSCVHVFFLSDAFLLSYGVLWAGSNWTMYRNVLNMSGRKPNRTSTVYTQKKSPNHRKREKQSCERAGQIVHLERDKRKEWGR